jgi:hypothetical protein
MATTPVPVYTKIKCRTGRLWTYVRDNQPFGRAAAPGIAVASSVKLSAQEWHRLDQRQL